MGKVLALVQQYQKISGFGIAMLFEICIGVGIGNMFCRVYWY